MNLIDTENYEELGRIANKYGISTTDLKSLKQIFKDIEEQEELERESVLTKSKLYTVKDSEDDLKKIWALGEKYLDESIQFKKQRVQYLRDSIFTLCDFALNNYSDTKYQNVDYIRPVKAVPRKKVNTYRHLIREIIELLAKHRDDFKEDQDD